MKPPITKRYLAFILLVSGMFSFSVADAQYVCDCVPGKPTGYCVINNQGQTKCIKLKIPHHGGTWFVNSQTTESASLNISLNPVSNSPTTSFFLVQSQKVSIKVFDMNGRLVSMLADKMFEAGENKIPWKADNVSTGIYFLQIQSAENVLREKLFVTK